MESNIIQTYTLILYSKKDYYGEKDILHTYIMDKNIDKNIAVNYTINKSEYSDKYWLYEITLTNVEEVYNKKRKETNYITTKSIIDRVKISEMLF